LKKGKSGGGGSNKKKKKTKPCSVGQRVAKREGYKFCRKLKVKHPETECKDEKKVDSKQGKVARTRRVAIEEAQINFISGNGKGESAYSWKKKLGSSIEPWPKKKSDKVGNLKSRGEERLWVFKCLAITGRVTGKSGNSPRDGVLTEEKSNTGAGRGNSLQGGKKRRTGRGARPYVLKKKGGRKRERKATKRAPRQGEVAEDWTICLRKKCLRLAAANRGNNQSWGIEGGRTKGKQHKDTFGRVAIGANVQGKDVGGEKLGDLGINRGGTGNLLYLCHRLSPA